MQTTVTDSETAWLLNEWGKWAFHARGLALNYPGMTPERRLCGSAVAGAMISDDLAECIDHAVAQVVQDDPQAGEALTWYYLVGGTYRSVGKRLGVGHKCAGARIKRGVGQVAELLAG